MRITTHSDQSDSSIDKLSMINLSFVKLSRWAEMGFNFIIPDYWSQTQLFRDFYGICAGIKYDNEFV